MGLNHGLELRHLQPRASRAVSGRGIRAGRGVAIVGRVVRVASLPGLALRLESRQKLLIERVHALLMLLAALTILVRSAGLVVQVPLPGDVGILQAVGPAADLAGDGFATGFEICDLRFQIPKAGRTFITPSIERTSPADPRA